MYVVAPGGPLTQAELDHMTQTYQQQIRKSPRLLLDSGVLHTLYRT